MRVALIHDWLLGVGGAEKVLKTFHEIFPQAPVYVLFHDPEFTGEFLPGVDIRPTFLQETYRAFGGHKLLTPFLPLAVESVDLTPYDVVISTAQFSKGLILKPRTIHINYCASPTRQVWDWQIEYRDEKHKLPKLPLLLFQHFLRIWDRHASTRVDRYIANSQNTRQRIRKYYRRDAAVIYPPVETSSHMGAIAPKREENYWLIVSRLFKHKNIHLAVKAFSKLGWPLVVIGDGPEKNRLQRLANHSADIVFLGYQPNEIIQRYYANCLAFVMPQEEDFGITPIEAMSCGKPVLALKKGGALEYIEEGINGEFFEDPLEEMLADGARRLKENLPGYNPEQIKRTAERFGKERFKKEINEILGTWISSYFSGAIDSGAANQLRQKSKTMSPILSWKKH